MARRGSAGPCEESGIYVLQSYSIKLGSEVSELDQPFSEILNCVTNNLLRARKNYCHVTWLQDLGKVTWTTRDYQFHFWHPIHNAKRCFFWQDLSRCQNRRNVFQTVLYPQCLWRSSTQYLILMDKSLSQARLSATTIITSCTVRPHWVRPVARSQGMTNSTCRLPGAQVGFVNIVNEDCRVDAWS